MADSVSGGAAPAAAATDAGAGAGAGGAGAAAAAPSGPVTGEVLICGSVSHSMTGRKDPPSGWDGVPETNLYNFSRIEGLTGKPIVSVATGSNAAHYAAVDAAGALYVWGRNEKGNLGLGHLNNVYKPTRVHGIPPVSAVAIGRTHTLILTKDGDIMGCGSNATAQLGTMKSDQFVTFTKANGMPAGQAAAIATGDAFSLAIDKSGRVYSCGSQQYGQCGTGATGEWIVSAGRVAFQEVTRFEPIAGLAGVKCTQIAAGANHGVALTDDGQVYTWGWGAFGRLGHGGTADELSPKLVKVFEPERMRVQRISAGSSITYCIAKTGLVFHFGITKKSGEAQMKPDYIRDLAGFQTRCASAGTTSVIIAADNSVISYGPAPTCGELGYGPELKSSTKPKLVDDLEGVCTLQCAMGLGTSLVLLDTSSGSPAAEEAKKRIAEGKFPLYVPEEPKPGAGAGAKRKAEEEAAAGGASGGGKGKGGAVAKGGAAKKGKK